LVSDTPEILKRELAKQWRFQLETFPHPLQLVEEDGTVIKNRALVAQETAKVEFDEFLDHQHQLELRDTQIRVLTEKILELQRQALPEVAEQEQEEENASLTLAVWKATSVKPGLCGLSLDLKTLTSDTVRIIRDRTRLIELDLNKRLFDGIIWERHGNGTEISTETMAAPDRASFE